MMEAKGKGASLFLIETPHVLVTWRWCCGLQQARWSATMAMGWSDEATGGWHVPYRSWISDTPPLENRKLVSMLSVLCRRWASCLPVASCCNL